MTSLLQAHACQVAGPSVQIDTVTARFGAPYIACEATYAVAGHAVLDAWACTLAAGGTPPDAVLIGCFGDPGLLALRESSRAPVTGLAEAAFTEAARYGPFAIVTGGQRWKPMLERLAHQLGYGHVLQGIHAVAPTGAQLARDPVAAHSLLVSACQRAVRDFKVNAVILGGAGLAGMAAAAQADVAVPIIDSVLAGTRQALLRAGQRSGLQTVLSSRFDVCWQGVSAEMAQLGLPAGG
ncbi:MAG: Asp/Glu racemase [Polaromonas sp.]|nr:MAG: Asp/Glu racemase [Polaromonas sp.]